MSHESDIERMEDHFMSPSYYDPEIVEVAKDWWTRTEEQRLAFAREEGPSPLRELLEDLSRYGITMDEPMEVMELMVIASGKFNSQQEE